MAKIFTTLFYHHNKVYTAVITQLESTTVFYVPDESLHHIIPDGRFSYPTQQGLQLDVSKMSPLQALVLDIFAAMEGQDQKQIAKIS